jgi:U6 snRNA-associated Sm-like protein LSm4
MLIYNLVKKNVSNRISWQIKYLRVPDEIIDLVKEQQSRDQGSGYRGGRGGAQRGDHRGGGDRGRGRGGARGRGRGRGS